jgi:hypothetical protein
MNRLIIAFLLLASSAYAEEQIYITPQIPTEQEKIDALKMAYELNGNSMVRSIGAGNIDLSGPAGFSLPKSDRIIPLTKPHGRKTAP